MHGYGQIEKIERFGAAEPSACESSRAAADLWSPLHRSQITLILLWGELDFFTPAATALYAILQLGRGVTRQTYFIQSILPICEQTHLPNPLQAARPTSRPQTINQGASHDPKG